MASQKKVVGSRWAYVIQLIEYSVSGGAYFWSGYLVFFICDHYLGWSLWWAKLAANIVGVTVNYLLERFWVFNRSGHKRAYEEAPFRYLLLTACNFVIDYWIVYGLSKVGISPYLGQFGSAGFFWVWNWLWYKYWVFGGTISKSENKVKAAKHRAARRQKRQARRRG